VFLVCLCIIILVNVPSVCALKTHEERRVGGNVYIRERVKTDAQAAADGARAAERVQPVLTCLCRTIYIALPCICALWAVLTPLLVCIVTGCRAVWILGPFATAALAISAGLCCRWRAARRRFWSDSDSLDSQHPDCNYNEL
jgi:hypothetical protein